MPASLRAAEYAEFARIRDELIASGLSASEISQPHCGWIGDLWDRRRFPTILYIGKATYDRNEFDDISTALYEDQALDYDHSLLRRSAFWRNLNQILDFIIEYSGVERPEPTRAIAAWTNVMKLSGRRRNPPQVIVKAQSEVALRILCDEVRRLDPAIVWTVTGDDYEAEVHKVLDGAAGRDGWIRSEDGAYMYREDAHRFIAWTMHPQGKGLRYTAANRTLSKLAADAWRRHRS
jgi:hypothetical protein